MNAHRDHPGPRGAGPTPRQEGGDGVGERVPGGIEVEFAPAGARDRPVGFVALDEFVDVAHLQQHARLPVEAVVLAAQEMVEEAQLQLAAIVGVEVGPVLDAVRLQPLVLGCRSHEAFEIAPGMDALPDVKQLQLETRRKAQAIDKMVNPPMIADPALFGSSGAARGAVGAVAGVP